MPLYLIEEPEYRQSVWSKKSVALVKKLKEKKIEYKQINEISEISDFNNSVLVAISDVSSWKRNIIAYCNAVQLPIIILTDGIQHNLGGIYNSVSVDFSETLATLNDYLGAYEKKRIAIFGVNQNSDSDLDLVEKIYTEIKFEVQDVPIVYNNNENLEKSFWDFFENREKYDAVICVNDLVALYFTDMLKKHDKATLERLFIISFNALILSALHSPSITSFSADDSAFVNAIIEIYQILKDSKEMSRIHIRIRQELRICETTGFLPLVPKKRDYGKKTYYGEANGNMLFLKWLDNNNLNTYNSLEKMFAECDKQDFLILLMLQEGNTVTEIAERTFTSLGSVKYRIQKMLANSGTENKRELLELLKSNVNKENFEGLIK